jgi:hypothetical protein
MTQLGDTLRRIASKPRELLNSVRTDTTSAATASRRREPVAGQLTARGGAHANASMAPQAAQPQNDLGGKARVEELNKWSQVALREEELNKWSQVALMALSLEDVQRCLDTACHEDTKTDLQTSIMNALGERLPKLAPRHRDAAGQAYLEAAKTMPWPMPEAAQIHVAEAQNHVNP